MSYASVFLPIVSRLSRLVKRQYGCHLTYRPICEIESRMQSELGGSLVQGHILSHEESAFLPIFSETTLVGAACISQQQKKSRRDMKYLYQFIRTVFEYSLRKADHIGRLEEFEDRLGPQFSKTTISNNVVSLKSYRKNMFPLPQKPIVSPLHFPLLIVGQSADDTFKMALELHSRSGHYAFLPIEDLSPEIFESTESIHALGHTSIYIRDLTSLSPEKQKAIFNYYQSVRNVECPQFISGSKFSFGDLLKSPLINQDLLSILRAEYERDGRIPGS